MAAPDLSLGATRVSDLSYPLIQFCSIMNSFLSGTMFPSMHQLSQTDLQYEKARNCQNFMTSWPHIKLFNPYHFISRCFWISFCLSFFPNLTWKQILFALQMLSMLYLKLCSHKSVHRKSKKSIWCRACLKKLLWNISIYCKNCSLIFCPFHLSRCFHFASVFIA